MMVRALLGLFFGFFIWLTIPSASALELKGVFMQGGLIAGKGDPGTKIFLDGQEIFVGANGNFIFGFGRNAPQVSNLTIRYPNGTEDNLPLSIVPQSYPIERVDGVPPETVEIPKEEQERRERELGMVREARASRSPFLDWVAGFMIPTVGKITGVYGSERVLNGEPSTPHYGLDIAAPLGTEVLAPAGGRIVLAEADFLLEGGIIIIDHGFKVFSTMLHLSKLNVAKGQIVRKGDVVGAVGATGRVSGPHLDWRVNWGEVRLDPALVVGQGPAGAQ